MHSKNFVALHQSTLCKVDVIGNIFYRTADRQLKTNTTWWEMRGGALRSVANWVADNKIVAFLLATSGLLVGIFGWHPWS